MRGGWKVRVKGGRAHPVVESATHALVVDPDLPLPGAAVPALAGMVPLVKSQRIIQSVQVVAVDVQHVVRTPWRVRDPR